jgi:hypothetical protein
MLSTMYIQIDIFLLAIVTFPVPLHPCVDALTKAYSLMHVSISSGTYISKYKYRYPLGHISGGQKEDKNVTVQ